MSRIAMVKGSCSHTKSLESGPMKRDAKTFSWFENDHILNGTTDYPQRGEFPVNHSSHDNGVYMKQCGTALGLYIDGNLSSTRSDGKEKRSLCDSNRDKVKALKTAAEKVEKYLAKGDKCESLVKANHASPSCKDQSHVNIDRAQKNVKNHTRRDLFKQNKHTPSGGKLGNHYGGYDLESPRENTFSDPNCKVEASSELVESLSSKAILLLHPEEEDKKARPSGGSQLVGQSNICDGHPVETAGNGDLSKAPLRNKTNGTSYHLQRLASETIGVKDEFLSSPSRANQSVQTACTVFKRCRKTQKPCRSSEGAGGVLIFESITISSLRLSPLME